MDHFKQVNDTLGHSAGDQLLKEMSRRLQTCIRQNDMVARLGGDEFVIYLDNSKTEEDISPVLNRIISRLSYPFRLMGNELGITVSLGWPAYRNRPPTSASCFIRPTWPCTRPNATTAVASSAIRKSARSRPGPHRKRCWQERCVKGASSLFSAGDPAQGQPADRAGGDGPLDHRRGVLKDAFDFIPLAEQCGLIQELDYQILSHTCQQLKEWLPLSGQSKFKVAINLSGKHLVSHEQIMKLVEIIESEDSPGYLIFEFNERELSRQDSDALTSLHELRAKGIQISLDDFGTGFSSLNALFHFPVDYIKVDDSFTHRMLQSPKDLALIRAMRDICQDLDFTLVVEGIENQQQLQKLIDLGCLMGQGAISRRPCPEPISLPAHPDQE